MTASARLRVLVVDDAADLRRLVSMLLVESGADVVGEAADGGAAVDQARELQPDLVIMDWQMPVMDGVQSTALIRAACPATQVIAFSSAADPVVEERFLAAGAAGYVPKGDLVAFGDALRIVTAGPPARRPAAASADGSGPPPEPASGLELQVRAWPALERTHLTVRGTLDARTREQFAVAVGELLGPGHHLTLDLSEVTSIDAEGAHAIRDCDDLAAKQRAEVTVQDPSPAVRVALEQAA